MRICARPAGYEHRKRPQARQGKRIVTGPGARSAPSCVARSGAQLLELILYSVTKQRAVTTIWPSWRDCVGTRDWRRHGRGSGPLRYLRSTGRLVFQPRLAAVPLMEVILRAIKNNVLSLVVAEGKLRRGTYGVGFDRLGGQSVERDGRKQTGGQRSCRRCLGRGKTLFVTVDLAVRGNRSVIPRMLDQLVRWSITVTDPEIRRYFMLILKLLSEYKPLRATGDVWHSTWARQIRCWTSPGTSFACLDSSGREDRSKSSGCGEGCSGAGGNGERRAGGMKSLRVQKRPCSIRELAEQIGALIEAATLGRSKTSSAPRQIVPTFNPGCMAHQPIRCRLNR